MFINVDPADFFMYRVKLIYDLNKPDPEDQEARDYLAEYELIPRVQSTGEFEGSQSGMMVFGGCYLGRYLDQIGQIQRRAVETELLTAEIQRHLSSSTQADLELKEEERQEAVAGLVQTFNQESSFQTNEEGGAGGRLGQISGGGGSPSAEVMLRAQGTGRTCILSNNLSPWFDGPTSKGNFLFPLRSLMNCKGPHGVLL